MTFAAPRVLIALILIPALIGGGVLYEARRRRSTARLAAPALMASSTPRPPGWRRHLPPLIVVLALAVLILAAARPQHDVAIPIRGAAFVLANDVSESMTATDVRPTRLGAARAAAARFVAALPSSALVGQMSFARPAVLQSPHGRSPTRRSGDPPAQARGRKGVSAAQAVAPDPRLMGEIARLSHARADDVRSAHGLNAVFERLGTELSTVPRHRLVRCGGRRVPRRRHRRRARSRRPSALSPPPGAGPIGSPRRE